MQMMQPQQREEADQEHRPPINKWRERQQRERRCDRLSGGKQQRQCDKQQHHTGAIEIITSSLTVGSDTR
jgi:hypothetical protein